MIRLRWRIHSAPHDVMVIVAEAAVNSVAHALDIVLTDEPVLLVAE